MFSLNRPAEEYIESDVHSIPMNTALDDAQIRRNLELDLASTMAFSHEIEVTVHEGNVTLEGQIESNAEAILAENTARTADGVREVINNLVVSKGRRIA